MNNMLGICDAPPRHWISERFPVRSLFPVTANLRHYPEQLRFDAIVLTPRRFLDKSSA